MDILTTLLGKAAFSVLNFLFRRPLEAIGQWLFQEAYHVSSLHRSHRQLRSLWRDKLGEHLSYHINLQKLFLGKEQKHCTLWIKASHPGEFKSLTVRVDACLDNLRYQSTRTIYAVTHVPTVVALPDIPLREIENRRGRLYKPYSSVSIELVEILDAEGGEIPSYRAVRDSFHPMDNLAAALGREKSDVYRWGQWWNLSFLESEKQEYRISLHGRAFNARFTGSASRRFWEVSAWLAGKGWFLSLVFWYNNLVTARQLKRQLSAYLQEYPVRKDDRQTADAIR